MLMGSIRCEGSVRCEEEGVVFNEQQAATTPVAARGGCIIGGIRRFHGEGSYPFMYPGDLPCDRAVTHWLPPNQSGPEVRHVELTWN